MVQQSKDCTNDIATEPQFLSSYSSGTLRLSGIKPSSNIYTVNHAAPNKIQFRPQISQGRDSARTICRRDVARSSFGSFSREPKSSRHCSICSNIQSGKYNEEKNSCLVGIMRFFQQQCQPKKKPGLEKHAMFIHEDVQHALKQLKCDLERFSEYERCNDSLNFAKIDGESAKKILARMSFKIYEIEDKLLNRPNVPTCAELISRRQIMLNLIKTLQKSIGGYLESETEALKERQGKLCDLLKYLLSIENEFRYLTRSIKKQCCNMSDMDSTSSRKHSSTDLERTCIEKPCYVRIETVNQKTAGVLPSPPMVVHSQQQQQPQIREASTSPGTLPTIVETSNGGTPQPSTVMRSSIKERSAHLSPVVTQPSNRETTSSVESRPPHIETSSSTPVSRPPHIEIFSANKRMISPSLISQPNSGACTPRLPPITPYNTPNVYNVTGVDVVYTKSHVQTMDPNQSNPDYSSKYSCTEEEETEDNSSCQMNPDPSCTACYVNVRKGDNTYCDYQSQPLKEKMCELSSVWYESARQLLDSLRTCT